MAETYTNHLKRNWRKLAIYVIGVSLGVTLGAYIREGGAGGWQSALGYGVVGGVIGVLVADAIMYFSRRGN